MKTIKYYFKKVSSMKGDETFILGALAVSLAVAVDGDSLFVFGMGMSLLGLFKFMREDSQ
jgi:hypothetical protein